MGEQADFYFDEALMAELGHEHGLDLCPVPCPFCEKEENMSKANGIVEAVFEFPGKFGPMYSIRLEADDSKYGCKGTKPNCNEGDLVEFNWSTNNRGYPDVDLSSLVVAEVNAASTPAPETANTPAASPGRQAFDRKQNVIIYQSSRKDALEFFKTALEAGFVDIPAKGSLADKWQACRIFVDELTNDFADDAAKVYETGTWREDV